MWTGRVRKESQGRASAKARAAGLLSLTIALLMCTVPAGAAGGLVAKRSLYGVTETMDRLERAVKDRDLIVIARVDHAAAAQKVGLSLRPTQLLIFGTPKGGTPLMQSAQSIGIDLPLKAVAWEDDRGQVWLAYNDPGWLVTRHGVSDRPEVVKAMTAVLEALTDAATQGPR